MEAATEQSERLARLRLIRSENVGPSTYGKLMARFHTAEAALEALPEIAARAGRKRLRVASLADVEKEWRTVERFGARFLIQGDTDYPPLLAETDGSPPVLTIYGDVGLLHRPGFAIVGARNASSNGRSLCRRIAADLGKADLVIISGLARGIDAEAHTATLETGTIAVVAGGIDVIYPPENEKLQRDIAERGLLIAESAFGTRPIARHFPKRNRIISALSQGVLVVEAALRSGSLITARQAGEQGREVFAVPGSPLDPRARGANRLIRDGARLVEEADDILDELKPSLLRAPNTRYQPAVLPPPVPTEFVDDQAAVAALLEALSAEPADADSLIRTAGLTAPTFNAAILELEIGGRVARHAGNRYALKLDRD